MKNQPISARIKEIRDYLGQSQKEISRNLGCSYQAWQGYEAGNNLPGGKTLLKLNILGISVDWLLTGRGLMQTKYLNSEARKTQFIPRIDSHLKNGTGSIKDRMQVIEHIPFTEDYLRKFARHTKLDGLIMLEMIGDNMEPTIKNGEMVMIDIHDTQVSGALMALSYENCAYVKRLHKLPGGIDIVSDNKTLYPSHHVKNTDFNQQGIIGRVCWIGKSY